jgi:hypothetical protein
MWVDRCKCVELDLINNQYVVVANQRESDGFLSFPGKVANGAELRK